MSIELLSALLTAFNLAWSGWLKLQSDRAKIDLEHVLKAQAKIEAQAQAQDKKIESLIIQIGDKDRIIQQLTTRVEVLEADKTRNEKVIEELKAENKTLKEMLNGQRLL